MACIGDRCPDYTNIANICTDLNSFDRKRFEEPDFERRMTQFMSIRDQLRGDAVPSITVLKAILYNCSFYLVHVTDSSLKSNALDTLLQLTGGVKRLSETELEMARRFINKVVLEQIRQGIKSKDDMVRLVQFLFGSLTEQNIFFWAKFVLQLCILNNPT